MTREEYELKKAEIEKIHYECVEILNQEGASLQKKRESEWRYYTRELEKLNKLFQESCQR